MMINMIGQFLNFLGDNNCLHEFINNFSGRSYDEFFRIASVKEWVVGAFPWSQTPENTKFWSKIDEKWREMIK